MTTHSIVIAFLFTLAAGLATGIGGLLGVLRKNLSSRSISAAMGFSAGLLLFTAFAEVLEEGREHLDAFYGPDIAGWAVFFSFFGGIVFVMLVSALMPKGAHHHHHDGHCCVGVGQRQESLQKTGILTMFAIGMHNFPEGVALFSAAAADARLGAPLALAIALHNIPIGLSIAMPIYVGTNRKAYAVGLSLAAGLVTPVGGAAALLLFGRLLGGAGLGFILSAAAGIMSYAALSELYPCAREEGGPALGTASLVGGMAFMALILQIFH